MKLLLIPAAAVCMLPLASCEKTGSTGDATFARETFVSLAKGDTAVQSKIDWGTFTAMGQDVGGQYNAIPTETEKQEFRNLFVTQFATSFRQSGGSVDKFNNWRVTFNDSTRTEVAADSPGGQLRLTVSERDSTERVSSIDLIR